MRKYGAFAGPGGSATGRLCRRGRVRTRPRSVSSTVSDSEDGAPEVPTDLIIWADWTKSFRPFSGGGSPRSGRSKDTPAAPAGDGYQHLPLDYVYGGGARKQADNSASGQR